MFYSMIAATSNLKRLAWFWVPNEKDKELHWKSYYWVVSEDEFSGLNDLVN